MFFGELAIFVEEYPNISVVESLHSSVGSRFWRVKCQFRVPTYKMVVPGFVCCLLGFTKLIDAGSTSHFIGKHSMIVPLYGEQAPIPFHWQGLDMPNSVDAALTPSTPMAVDYRMSSGVHTDGAGFFRKE